MKFIIRLASSTLAALCIVGAAGAAYAHHIPQQPYVESETQTLLEAAQSVGIRFYTEGDPNGAKRCSQGLLGQANDHKQVLICVKNHGDSVDELADTLRHELTHSAQFCKGRNNGKAIELLFPEQAMLALRAAQYQLHMPTTFYKPAQYAAEAEARVAAQVLDESGIAELLIKHCK